MVAKFGNADGTFLNENDSVPWVTNTPTAGATVKMKWDQRDIVVRGTATLSSLTIDLPFKVNDGEHVRIAAVPAITSLTVNTGFGTIVPSAPVSMIAGQVVDLVYTDKTDGYFYANPNSGNEAGEVEFTSVGGLVAHSGGGSASATPLTGQLSRIVTVAATLDSVLLPVPVNGDMRVVINDGTQDAGVYSAGTATIDGINGQTTGVVLTHAKRDIFFAVSGAWFSLEGVKSV